MTADDYPTVAAIDAHIATEQHTLTMYQRQLANLRGNARDMRIAADELAEHIEVTRLAIDVLLDIRLAKTAVLA